jgi:hypothetical protein
MLWFGGLPAKRAPRVIIAVDMKVLQVCSWGENLG